MSGGATKINLVTAHQKGGVVSRQELWCHRLEGRYLYEHDKILSRPQGPAVPVITRDKWRLLSSIAGDIFCVRYVFFFLFFFKCMIFVLIIKQTESIYINSCSLPRPLRRPDVFYWQTFATGCDLRLLLFYSLRM